MLLARRTANCGTPADGSGHATACHRWGELPAMAVVAKDAWPAPGLERLMAEFTRKTDGRGANGVATLAADNPVGAPGQE